MSKRLAGGHQWGDEWEKEHRQGGPPGCRAGLTPVHTKQEDRGLCGKGLTLRHGTKQVLARLTGHPGAGIALEQPCIWAEMAWL